MRYSTLKYGAFISLFLYLVIGMMSDAIAHSETFARFSNGQEIYSIFNWQLFSYIPNEKDEYSMELYRLGAEQYDPPLQYADMTSLFYAVNASPTEYTPRIRKLGKAIEDGDSARIQAARKELEGLFRGRQYSYGILKVHLDPVEYWKTGEYSSSEVLMTFSGQRTDP